MPARKGATSLNISIGDDLASQLTRLAAAPEYGSKSQVIEVALQRLLEGSPEQSAVDGLHQHVATVGQDVRTGLHATQDRLITALATLEHALDAMTGQMEALTARVTALEKHLDSEQTKLVADMQEFQKGLNRAYDHLAARLPRPKTKWWG